MTNHSLLLKVIFRMEKRCIKCNATFFYLGFFVSKGHNLVIKNQVVFDENVPTRYFWFVCRGCENMIELIDSHGKLRISESMRNLPYKDILEKINWK